MKRQVLVTIVLLVSLAALSAQTATRSFETAGYRVMGQRTESGLPTWDLQDNAGNRFSVSMEGTLNARRADAIQAIRNTFFSIPGLQVQRLRIVFEGNRADLVVVPQRFLIQDADVVAYMPSGMQFTYTDFLEYDFRMRVNNLFLRMNGQYFSAEQFIERIAVAIENPALYVQSQDPQFLFGRLDSLNDQIEGLKTDGRALTAEMRQQDADLQLALDAYASEGMRMYRQTRQETESAVTDLSTRIDVLTEEHQALLGAHRELQVAHEALREEFDTLVGEKAALESSFETLRDGSVVLFTRSLFGAVKEIEPTTVAAIVAVRTAEPELPYADAAAKVAEETGVEVDKKHALAVYALFFNDYE